jgi:hypothetical protein
MKASNKLAKAVSDGIAIVTSDENRLWRFVSIGHLVLHEGVKASEIIKRVKAKTGKTIDKGDLSKAVRINKACVANRVYKTNLENGKYATLNDAYNAAVGFTVAMSQRKTTKRKAVGKVVVTKRKAESLAKRFVPANKRDAFVRALGITA